MDEGETDNDQEHTTKTSDHKQPRLKKLRNSLRTFGRRSFRRIHDPGFVVEVLALIGLVAYVEETRRTNNLTKQTLDHIVKNDQSSSEQTDKLINTAVRQSQDTETLAEATRAQALNGLSTLEQMQSSFTIEQRPYLIAGPPGFANNTTVGPANPTGATNIVFANTGKTPAKSIYSSFELVPYRGIRAPAEFIGFIDGRFKTIMDNIRKDASDTNVLIDKQDLAPDQELPFITIRLSEPITLGDFAKLQTGDVALIALGVTRYRDAPSTWYQTDYCSFYFGGPNSPWHICPTHNTIR